MTLIPAIMMRAVHAMFATSIGDIPAKATASDQRYPVYQRVNGCNWSHLRYCVFIHPLCIYCCKLEQRAFSNSQRQG